MKKKFILLSLLACIFLVGCTPIQEMSLNEIINTGTNRTVSVYNKYRKGYKYNLPRGLEVTNNTEYNEIIESNKYVYYLYVDVVSYYNKVIEKYEENNEAHVSMRINYQDKYGYLEINQLNDDNYFIEIMYNYAKIEVIVKKRDINVVVYNSMSILASINFNDDILKSLLDEEVSNFKEVQFDIFETTTTAESECLEAVKEEETKKEEDIHDSDLIN